MRYVVIGGAGAMGQITVRDLVETCAPNDEIVVADYDINKAEALVRKMASEKASATPRLTTARVDVNHLQETSKALDGASVVINSVHYKYNLNVMEAALRAQTHYVDLGGLFHMTKKQLELNDRFRSMNRLALIGMGAAPGITNILARHGADQLDKVSEIHARVAGKDLTKYKRTQALSVSYSLKTILEEFSFEPAVFTHGTLKFVSPMSGADPMRFPPPIGTCRPMYTIHSEVATLPQSFAAKGVREVSFKIAFDEEFLDRVRFLRDLGLASQEPITMNGAHIIPIDFINLVAMKQPAAEPKGKMRQVEVVRVIVKGQKKGKKKNLVLDCITEGMPSWGIGLDIDTGAPPSIAAQMIANGVIDIHGVVPPELCVPPEPFFKELKRRGMKLKIHAG